MRLTTAARRLQVKLDASGAVIVNEGMQTSVENVYAIGDVIGP